MTDVMRGPGNLPSSRGKSRRINCNTNDSSSLVQVSSLSRSAPPPLKYDDACMIANPSSIRVIGTLLARGHCGAYMRARTYADHHHSTPSTLFRRIGIHLYNSRSPGPLRSQRGRQNRGRNQCEKIRMKTKFAQASGSLSLSFFFLRFDLN